MRHRRSSTQWKTSPAECQINVNPQKTNSCGGGRRRKWLFTRERAPRWSRVQTPSIHTSLAAASLLLALLRIENITLCFTRGLKRTEHLLSYRKQRTGKVMYSKHVPPTQAPVNGWATSVELKVWANWSSVKPFQWVSESRSQMILVLFFTDQVNQRQPGGYT